MVTAIGGHDAGRSASAASMTARSSRAAACGSGASDSAEITATPSAPAAIVAAALDASMPAMAQIGKLRRRGGETPRRSARDRPAPIGGLGLSFDVVANTPPIADVVEKIDRRGLGLRDRLDREPDDRPRAEQPARVRDRHVVLADMHAVGAAASATSTRSLIRSGTRERPAPP